MIHIVLYEPEIPQNTGNIMRTCAAINAQLHLIQPLGFILDDKRVRRSVMDYVEQLDYVVHESWEHFLQTVNGELFFLTRYGRKPHSAFDYTSVKNDTYLVFGSESRGIPRELLKQYESTCFRIPMSPIARSLNLSNAVAICAYEVMRQYDYPEMACEEVLKGNDYIARE